MLDLTEKWLRIILSHFFIFGPNLELVVEKNNNHEKVDRPPCLYCR